MGLAVALLLLPSAAAALGFLHIAGSTRRRKRPALERVAGLSGAPSPLRANPEGSLVRPTDPAAAHRCRAPGVQPPGVALLRLRPEGLPIRRCAASLVVPRLASSCVAAHAASSVQLGYRVASLRAAARHGRAGFPARAHAGGCGVSVLSADGVRDQNQRRRTAEPRRGRGLQTDCTTRGNPQPGLNTARVHTPHLPARRRILPWQTHLPGAVSLQAARCVPHFCWQAQGPFWVHAGACGRAGADARPWPGGLMHTVLLLTRCCRDHDAHTQRAVPAGDEAMHVDV